MKRILSEAAVFLEAAMGAAPMVIKMPQPDWFQP
jgi:hypothetical protein